MQAGQTAARTGDPVCRTKRNRWAVAWWFSAQGIPRIVLVCWFFFLFFFFFFFSFFYPFFYFFSFFLVFLLLVCVCSVFFGRFCLFFFTFFVCLSYVFLFIALGGGIFLFAPKDEPRE